MAPELRARGERPIAQTLKVVPGRPLPHLPPLTNTLRLPRPSIARGRREDDRRLELELEGQSLSSRQGPMGGISFSPGELRLPRILPSSLLLGFPIATRNSFTTCTSE